MPVIHKRVHHFTAKKEHSVSKMLISVNEMLFLFREFIDLIFPGKRY